jgi:homeobox protein ESX1
VQPHEPKSVQHASTPTGKHEFVQPDDGQPEDDPPVPLLPPLPPAPLLPPLPPVPLPPLPLRPPLPPVPPAPLAASPDAPPVPAIDWQPVHSVNVPMVGELASYRHVRVPSPPVVHSQGATSPWVHGVPA